MRHTRLPTMLFILHLTGCAVFAGKADYNDYRKVRLARNEQEYLLAMQRYVQRHPQGRWKAQVEAERRSRETEVFESRKSERSGLEFYLGAFPDGLFARQAQSRLKAMQQVEKRREQESKQAKQRAIVRRQQQAELRRTWVTRFIDYWTRTLVAIRNWGDPVPEVARANQRFSRAFGASPRPRCSRDECAKFYGSDFAIPIPGGTRIERKVQLILRLRMNQGNLERAELLMPDRGFSRWYELENQTIIVDEDAEDRAQAVQWSTGKLHQLLHEIDSGLNPIELFSPPVIRPPSIRPAGESTDTSAQAPTAQDMPGDPMGSTGGQAGQPTPSVEELVAPVQEQPPDMVMDPLQIPPEGASPPMTEKAPDMVMDPLDVTTSDVATGRAPEPTGDSVQEKPGLAEVVPYQVRAFESGSLRIVVFASKADISQPAYDGLVIEKIGSE